VYLTGRVVCTATAPCKIHSIYQMRTDGIGVPVKYGMHIQCVSDRDMHTVYCDVYVSYPTGRGVRRHRKIRYAESGVVAIYTHTVFCGVYALHTVFCVYIATTPRTKIHRVYKSHIVQGRVCIGTALCKVHST
jgi:hypothetical protein